MEIYAETAAIVPKNRHAFDAAGPKNSPPALGGPAGG
jgi:hypothetical protein